MPLDRLEMDPRQLLAVERALKVIPKRVPWALHHAIRRTTQTVRVKIVRAIAAEIHIAQNKLYSKGNRRRPIVQEFDGRPVTMGAVRVKGRTGDDVEDRSVSWKRTVGRIPLTPSSFGARELKRGGVSYKISRAGPRKRIADAFLMRFKSGHSAAFVRLGSGAGGAQGRRSRGLAKLYGPSIPQVAEDNRRVRAILGREAAAILSKAVDAQIARIIEGQRPAAA